MENPWRVHAYCLSISVHTTRVQTPFSKRACIPFLFPLAAQPLFQYYPRNEKKQNNEYRIVYLSGVVLLNENISTLLVIEISRECETRSCWIPIFEKASPNRTIKDPIKD